MMKNHYSVLAILIVCLACVSSVLGKEERLVTGANAVMVPQCTNKTTEDLTRFLRFSGAVPDELGFYDSCINHNDKMTYYLLLYYNIYKKKTEIYTGICVSKLCSEQEVQEFYQAQSEVLFGKGVYSVHPRNPDDESIKPPKDWGYWAFIIFTVVLTVLIVISTCITQSRKARETKGEDFLVTRSTMKNFANANAPGVPSSVLTQAPGGTVIEASVLNQPKKRETPFLVLFDLVTNINTLLYPRVVNSSVQAFDLFRIMAMIWVILGHELAYRLTVSNNFLDKGFWDYTKNSWYFTYNQTAFYAVDIFLFMGGYVSIISMSKLVSSLSPLPPLKAIVLYLFFVVKRYMRIMPVYAFLLCFYYKVVPTLVSGPLAQGYLFDFPCNFTNFWQSFVLGWRSSVTVNTMCAGWCWYLAIDFQIFCTIPLILIISSFAGRNKKKVGMLICSILILVSIVDTFIVGFKHQIQYLNPRDKDNTMNNYYYAESVQRSAIYYVGCLFAYATMKDEGKKKAKGEEKKAEEKVPEHEQKLLDEKRKHKKMKVVRRLQTINFSVGLALITFITLILHYVFQWGRDVPSVARIWNVMFIAFGKILFVVGFMMVLLVVGFRFKGFGKYIAENRLMQLLANLSFSMYLFHFPLIKIRTFSQKSVPTYAGLELLSAGLFELTATLFLALFAALFVEIPAMNLWRVYCEGYLTSKLKKKEKPSHQHDQK